MRRLISVILLFVIAAGFTVCVSGVPIGANAAKESGNLREDKVNFGRYYNMKALKETGAANVVASVVVSYRGFDTLGEVTVLFIAAVGLAMVLYSAPASAEASAGAPAGAGAKAGQLFREPASLIVFTGCRFLFPLILLFGTYIFFHGHLTPGGGFQGGAIVASAFLLMYLGCRGRALSRGKLSATESLSGLAFVVMGLVGLSVGGSFLLNFLPRGSAYALASAGIIPLIYIAIGFKVGSGLGGIIDNLTGGRRA